MSEWYFAEGEQRQGPLPVEDIRQRFQRGQLTLDTLVWREGMGQWAALRQVVDELGLQTLASASENAGGGIDLRGDYAAIDNGTAPLPGTGAMSSPYSAPASGVSSDGGYGPVQGGEVVLAGFWKRVAAYLIDYAVVTTVTSVVGFVVVLAMVGMSGLADESGMAGIAAQLVNMVISLALSCAYYAWFHASGGGATLGKMAIGIKVVRPDGERLSIPRAIGRYFGFVLSGVILCAGYVMAAFTDRKQALHDMMSDTLVVDRWAFTDHPERQRRELGTVAMVVLIIGAVLVVLGVVLGIALVAMLAKGFG